MSTPPHHAAQKEDFRAPATDPCASGFLRPFADELAEARAEVVRRVAPRLADLNDTRSDALEAILAMDQQRMLLPLVVPTFVLELNVARLSGTLQGTTSAERFQYFVEQCLGDRDVAARLLDGEYAVLPRTVRARLGMWQRHAMEWLGHLITDWRAIVTSFPEIDQASPLTRAVVTGDYHNGGRAVRVLTFGDRQRLVYKPRSLLSDLAFEHLIAWLNTAGLAERLGQPKTLDQGDHGWSEFREARDCDDVLQVQRFYRRLGVLLCLFWICEASDIHQGNIIAHGEWPVVVDLEGLFHGCSPDADDRSAASKYFLRSVARGGILPGCSLIAKGERLDLSVLGSALAADRLVPVPGWKDNATDEMRLEFSRRPFAAGACLPRIGGTVADPLEYVDDLVRGFRTAYAVCTANRVELCAGDGPLARCSGISSRFVPRSSQVYADVLAQLRHPDTQRDEMARERVLMRLATHAEPYPGLQQIAPMERRQLLDGDIPLFHSSPASRTLQDGHAAIEDFFKTSALVTSFEKVQAMGDADRIRQEWLIGAALATLPSNDPPRPGHAITPPTIDAVQAATRVADRLVELNCGSLDAPWWPTIQQTRQEIGSIRTLGDTLYDGVWGVGIFFGALAAVTGNREHRAFAAAAVAPAIERLHRGDMQISGIGAFDGWGGVFYALTILRDLRVVCDVGDTVDRVLSNIDDQIAEDATYDVIAGTAGAIAALGVRDQIGAPAACLELAERAGEHLLARATRTDGYVTWPSPHFSRALTGFGHGQAGIAWALEKAAVLCQRDAFREVAASAIAYEGHVKSRAHGNWPDLRDPSKSEFMIAWCHGAVGIGLARFDTQTLHGDERFDDDVTMALETASTCHLQLDHSLCHGNLGRLEFLTRAGRRSDRPEFAERAAALTRHMFADIEQRCFGCSILGPVALDTPGLMTGLSGIGLGMLRIAAPDLVPNVLRSEERSY